MAWAIVGYHAMELLTFEKLKAEDLGHFTMIAPMQWCPTPLQAISLTRKNLARQLGISLSVPEQELASQGKPMKAKSMRKLLEGTQALEQPNYMVLRLRTQENLPEVMAKGLLRPRPYGFEAPSFEPFSRFKWQGEWELDFVPLGKLFIDHS